MLRKGSASASSNFKEFLKNKKKEQDPEKKKHANKLLRTIMCEQWQIIALALPLSFLGTVQDFGTSHYIGKCVDALALEDYEDFNY